MSKWPHEYAVIDSQPGNLEAFAEVRRDRRGAHRLSSDRGSTGRAPTGRVEHRGVPARRRLRRRVLEDITDRANAAKALRRQALHDGLTGLPNRALLADRLDAHSPGRRPTERPRWRC